MPGRWRWADEVLAKRSHVEQIIGAAVQLVGEDGERMKKTLEKTCEPGERNCAVLPEAHGQEGRDEMTHSTITTCRFRRQR
jgi:hypothetical protein